MWENALYVGGRPGDDGVIETGARHPTVGAAVCWEFMRSGTARRLRGRVDLVLGGSNWWSVPAWFPTLYTAGAERRNAANAAGAPTMFGRYIGAPVVHAAISGDFRCPLPEFPPFTYRGHFEGGAQIADAQGAVLARRERSEGSGYVIADVDATRTNPADEIPDAYWLHRRGLVPATAWNTQRILGRRWYAAHVR